MSQSPFTLLRPWLFGACVAAAVGAMGGALLRPTPADARPVAFPQLLILAQNDSQERDPWLAP
ncbi:hypothetical protein M9M90_15675 [Phenylobacterium sp. LH3H17]|uniref:hypothetical protein n=1 Tax=Phenylobacterium sp. LH3H17 TaxID=2903901 RepID=UPI0020C9C2E4|nr:hypothetical protein [Phenylobacterium sp. LH3H17]UTP38650.1 hypothetical protein M9M90_15675 [Phenylobacterium sp. LH3H17]